jgi:hypothetical protein
VLILGESEVQGLLAAWRNARNNRSTAYLTSTLEFQPASFSPKDMMLNEAKQYMATEIARLMNVPAYYISADMNNSMTYANVQDERRQFVSLSLQPYITAIEQRLSMNDITPSTQYMSFDLDSGFLRANPMERLDVIEKMLTLGLITPKMQWQWKTYHRTEVRQMQLTFSSDIECDQGRRIISGKIVPYDGEIGQTSVGKVVFEQGSIQLPEPNKSKLLLEHDAKKPIGKAVAFNETADGVYASFKVSNTSRGTDSLIEASDGLRSGLECWGRSSSITTT